MTPQRIAITGTCQVEPQPFEPPAEVGPGEILVAVEASLISPGTELGGYNAAGRTQASYPGYTAVGHAERLGHGVPDSLQDQRVLVFPAPHDSGGCHASHKLVAAGGLTAAVPDGLDPGAACFARMVNIALTPYRSADPKIRGTVLVLGLGLVGNLVTQVGRILGFRTIGLDPDAARRAIALETGADAVIDPATDPLAAVWELTGGQGAELTVNATGWSDAFPLALKATATGGELSTLGGARHPATGDLREVFAQIHNRHLTVRGGWELRLPYHAAPGLRVPSIEQNLHDAFRWLQSGAVRLDPIWTHRIPPSRFKEAYDALNGRVEGWLGVVVEWT